LATVWFADDERALATTIGSLSTPVGAIMGMITGPMFISDSDKYSHYLGRKHMVDYMFISSIIITCMNIGVLFCFREKPSVPPSQAAM
jgi:sugar phosphate permease